MYNKLWKWSGIIGGLFLALSIAGMLFYSAKRPLFYMQNAYALEEGQEERASTIRAEDFVIVTPLENASANAFYIPVYSATTQDDIYIENNYIDRMITITIKHMNADFYQKNNMQGKLQGIHWIQAASGKGEVVIVLKMDHVYEYEAYLENQKLCMSFERSKDVYDKIVIIDAGHGGVDNGVTTSKIVEKSLVLDVVTRIKTLLSDRGVMVYYTRLREKDMPAEKRAELANDIGDCYVVSIHLSDDERFDYGITTYYNETYYIPELTNAQFADIMERNTAKAVSNRANGIFPYVADESGEDEVLALLTVPAARVELGYPSNAKEAQLLEREDYIEDLAKGIVSGIIEAFTR